ncbi:hypothetical protein DPSP01_004207 [Paraphaeosphaeria sporulosa]|uniref:Uncharacterized protein n=1 Tax=Paraphaeosphaeria sporulosa TaxID=1460663 RepID=A0A177CAI1_9PLEO|nr:uncharacterized protein CC84DRAFT_1218026 [Paraphaeosphaeria sporulosa]OAG04585.1 hypothetical protein CC84DRAFT_1218026 [Paraphaeosphaeria sporulosa]
MHPLATVSVCLAIILTAIAAGKPPNIETATLIVDPPAGVAATPTTAQEPNLISANMAPILSDTLEPHTPPSNACGQAVQMSFFGSTWILSNACHPFTKKGDIAALVVEFINEGYTNRKSCAFGL